MKPVHVMDSFHWATRSLFGGTISVNIPSRWRDVSEIRQVPNHQEVFQDHSAIADDTLEVKGTGCCIVFEILEREKDLKDEEVVDYFFRDLALANGKGNLDADILGDNYSIDYKKAWYVGKIEGSEENDCFDSNLMPLLSVQAKAYSCIGFQNVSPLRNRSSVEEGKATRIKVELCVIRLEQVETDMLVSLSCPTPYHETFEIGDPYHHSDLFLDVLRSFQILDWSLFVL